MLNQLDVTIEWSESDVVTPWSLNIRSEEVVPLIVYLKEVTEGKWEHKKVSRNDGGVEKDDFGELDNPTMATITEHCNLKRMEIRDK